MAHDFVLAANNKEQVVPMMNKLSALLPVLRKADMLRVDSGYLSEANMRCCEEARIAP